MFDIIDNEIFLSRGDSATIEIEITDDEGESYTPLLGESVIFSLKSSVDQCKTLFTKLFTSESNSLVVELTQEDTSDLSFGVYKYDVILVTEDGIYTIITPHNFNLLEVVHNEINR